MIGRALEIAICAVVGLMFLQVVGTGIIGAIAAVMDSTIGLLILVGASVVFAALVALPLGLAIAWAWRWWRLSAINERRQAVFVAPDEFGRMPVHEGFLQTEAFAQRTFDTHDRSFTQNITSLHYAPKYSNDFNGIEQAEAAAAALQPTTFWQLYQANKLPRRGFLMGYDLITGDEVTADWKDLYSSLVGGKSGTGKSTLIRSILAQSALQGGRFVVCDPHFGSGDESLGASLQPLHSLLLCDIAADEKQMTDALRLVADVGQRRLQGKDKDRGPLVLVVDESTALLQRSNIKKQLTDTLAMIGQETRKVGVFALCIGQNFSSTVIDTTVRNSFVSMLSMQARRDVARVQSGSLQFGEAAESLKIGQCAWLDPRGELWRLAVPNCQANDLAQVGRTLGQNSRDAVEVDLQREVGTSKALPNHFQDAPNDFVEVIGSGGGSAVEVAAEVGSARAQLVINAFVNGDSHTKIAKEIYGISGGRKYDQVRSEIDEILRSHMMHMEG